VDISVSSRHVEVSPSLKSVAVEKIGRLDRYLDGMERAEVRFSEERNKRIENKEVCEVTLYGGGHIVRARVAAPDQFAAVDVAVEKLEHQLHKLKSRSVDRRIGKGHANGSKASSAVAVADDAEPVPQLVRTKRFPMKPMTTEEAVLQMEMLGHDFFFFLRSETSEPAVLYHRADGDVGLIEIEH
jgi:putative sigma-54 modulation protein